MNGSEIQIFIMLINIKMPTIVFIGMIKTASESLKARKAFFSALVLVGIWNFIVSWVEHETRKDMALIAISMNSALADKEFVLSLHHKLHVSTCINKPNDVHKHNQTIIHSINQSFLHKQQWNLPPWWNYLRIFIQRRSLIRQNRTRQILPFKFRPLTAHIRM